jgi:hypothetical protein
MFGGHSMTSVKAGAETISISICGGSGINWRGVGWWIVMMAVVVVVVLAVIHFLKRGL